MSKFLNEKPFLHSSNNGLTFSGTRCDFKDGVIVQMPMWEVTVAQIGADFAEFAAWHRSCIWDQMNGFQGYDCVDYTIVEYKEDEEEQEQSMAWVEP